MAALELDIDLAPCVIDLIAQADQRVVSEDQITEQIAARTISPAIELILIYRLSVVRAARP